MIHDRALCVTSWHQAWIMAHIFIHHLNWAWDLTQTNELQQQYE